MGPQSPSDVGPFRILPLRPAEKKLTTINNMRNDSRQPKRHFAWINRILTLWSRNRWRCSKCSSISINFDIQVIQAIFHFFYINCCRHTNSRRVLRWWICASSSIQQRRKLLSLTILILTLVREKKVVNNEFMNNSTCFIRVLLVLQNRAIKTFYGLHHRTHTDDLYCGINISSLKASFQLNCALFVHSIINGLRMRQQLSLSTLTPTLPMLQIRNMQIHTNQYKSKWCQWCV